MLDDSNYLKNRDSHQVFKSLAEDLRITLGLSGEFTRFLTPALRRVVIFADDPYAALAARAWQDSCQSFEVTVFDRQTSTPPLAGDCLTVVLSPAGAEASNYQLPVQLMLTCAGKNSDFAKRSGETRCFDLGQMSLQPSRFFIFYRALLLIEAAVLGKNLLKGAERSLANLQQAAETWSPAIPTKDNLAKQLAYEIIGKTPVIYAGAGFAPAAMKWKYNFNLISQQLAWIGSEPISTSLDFSGWLNQVLDKNYAVFYLGDRPEDFNKISRRLSGKMPHPQVVAAGNDDVAWEMMRLSLLGYFTALYLAFLNNAKLSKILSSKPST